MTPKQALKKFTSLKTDIEKWQFLFFLKDVTYEVMLDNDMTFVMFGHMDDELNGEFDHYVGWSSGVFDLLEAIGINRNGV